MKQRKIVKIKQVQGHLEKGTNRIFTLCIQNFHFVHTIMHALAVVWRQNFVISREKVSCGKLVRQHLHCIHKNVSYSVSKEVKLFRSRVYLTSRLESCCNASESQHNVIRPGTQLHKKKYIKRKEIKMTKEKSCLFSS